MSGTDRIGFDVLKEQSTQQALHAGADWTLVGSGDFNHDRQLDMLFWNTSTGDPKYGL